MKIKCFFLLFSFLFFLNTIYPQVLSLDGNWKMFRGDNPDYDSPGIDDNSWPEIELPKRNLMPGQTSVLFPANSSEKKGFVWYRKWFELTRVPSQPLLFQAGEIMNADEVYINGIKIGKTGDFPPHFRSGWSNFRSYEIAPDFLKKGKNLIAMRVYFDAESWITGPIILDTPEKGNFRKMVRDFFLIHLIESLSLLLAALFIFFLIYYFQRRNETEYLFFSLSSFSLSIALMLQFLENEYPYLPLSSNLIMAFTQTGLIFVGPLLSLFFKYQLYKKCSPTRFILTLLFPLAGSVLMFMNLPERSNILAIRNIFILSIPLFIILILSDVITGVVKKIKKAPSLGLSMIPIFIFSVHDILSFGFGLFNDGIAAFVYGFPLVLIIIAFQLIKDFVENLNENERLKIAFRRFVPEEFLNMLGRNNVSDIHLGDSTEKEIAVLFTDIRSFTALSEKMSPQQTFIFLNNYLKKMVPIIRQNQGFVDKYIGDAIMALFPEAPEDSIQAAISMRGALKEYNDTQYELGFLPVEAGTGINFGKLMMGTIGEESRMDSTVIADSVNLASRLERLTKIYGSSIIVSERVFLLASKKKAFPARFLDIVQVAGKEESVKIYEILADAGNEELIEFKKETKSSFEEALRYYFNGDFNRAKIIFKELYQKNETDRALKVYLQRCETAEKTAAVGMESPLLMKNNTSMPLNQVYWVSKTEH